MEKSGKRPHRRADHTESVVMNTPSTSTAVQTPSSHDDGDTTVHETLDEDMHMTVEEAMDMGSDDDLDADTGDEDDEDDTRGQGNFCPTGSIPSDKPRVLLEDWMDVDDVPLVVSPMRPPHLPPLSMAE